jgi:diguanylate cyclase (GGDEF)-like protein
MPQHMNAPKAVPTPEASPGLPQRVLLVENSRSYGGMLAEAVESRLRLPVTQVRSLAEAQAALESDPEIFLVCTGLVLPDASQEQILEGLSAWGLPMVVVSGVYDDALRQRLLGRTIVDYILKSTPGHIDYLVWLVQRLDRNRRISALVVDDSASARLLAAELLSLYGFRVLLAGDAQDALKVIEGDPSIRLVVTDHEMPGMSGVELTAALRAKHARDRLAVIGVSGGDNASLVARFLKNGANDFLHKPYSREEFFCRVSQNVDNLDLIGTLQDLATKDFLTGLSNRRHFFEIGGRRFDELVRASRPIAVATLDIDHFKRINDTHGHDGGDIALKAVAEAVRAHARPQDVVARFGGEEFCVIAPDLGADEAQAYFEGLRQRIHALEIQLPDHVLQLSVSIGVTVDPQPHLHAMLSESDRLLYLAKAGGRNRVTMREDAAGA